ncbi:hypothetical protein HZH66_001966 [Vespula vulgaris]|uniref:Uncharacterized protein n=1 Tax=Vespula vulgaris TaxID=7454 RepID=A0A834KM92_VESVU|nr:hypothetical protein HZH66_001966 [Vespula vulgaris]
MRTESRIRTETCNNKTRNLAPLKFPLVRGIAKSGYYVIDFQEFPNGTRIFSLLYSSCSLVALDKALPRSFHDVIRSTNLPCAIYSALRDTPNK